MSNTNLLKKIRNMNNKLLKEIGLILRLISLPVVILVFIGCSDNLELSGTHDVNNGSDEKVSPTINEASTLPQVGQDIKSGKQQQSQKDPSDTTKKEEPTPKTIPQPIIEFMGEYNSKSPEEKKQLISTHIDTANSEGKEVKICFYYDPEDYFPGVHKCALAQFLVFLNKKKSQTGIANARFAERDFLNLNNLGERWHHGISGKSYLVPNLLLPTERQKYMVPGTLYKTGWDKNGKVNITINCALPSCHDGIASMAVIGKLVIKNGGTSSEVTFIDRKTQIGTGTSTVYDASKQDLKLVSGNPSFDDWCQIDE